MGFYASPAPLDRQCFTLDSTGRARMTPVAVRFRRETWRSWQFMYTLRGEGVGDIEGRAFHASEHTVVILPPDQNHSYEPAKGCKLWEYRWIEFSGAMSKDFLNMFGLLGRSHVHGCRDAWPAVEEVYTTLESGGNAVLHEAAALFLRVLAIVEWRVRPERTRAPLVQQVDLAAKRFIADHLEEDICLEDVAAAVRTSPHHLIRVFKRNTHQTPMAYLRHLRAERAKVLLSRGELNIKQVGQRVGYPVLQHFSRMFRMETGQSPRAFMRGSVSRKDAKTQRTAEEQQEI